MFGLLYKLYVSMQGPNLCIINLHGESKCFQVTLMLPIMQLNKNKLYVSIQYTLYFETNFLHQHITISLSFPYVPSTRKPCIKQHIKLSCK
jgi:hypothetical protein